jgi:hypothetical protein
VYLCGGGNIVNLLKLTPDQLRKMDKKLVHNGYQKVIGMMLEDFYIESFTNFNGESIEDLRAFIQIWVEKKTKPPHEDWNPGDTGK